MTPRRDEQTASSTVRYLHRSAEILRDVAEDLHRSHTVDGEWPMHDDADQRAKSDHDEMLHVAAELEKLAAQQAGS